MKNILQNSVLILAVMGLSACNIDKSQPNVELIQDMMDSPNIKAQEYDEGSPNHIGMRVPPENTAPVGFEPYKYPTNVEEAARSLKNPKAQDMSQDVLMLGQRHYEISCAVCHGMKGEGGEKGSSVGGLMALKPPSILTDKVKGWTDGHIYHVITMGQGLMGPYASHVPQEARWQLVNYIRHLQK